MPQLKAIVETTLTEDEMITTTTTDSISLDGIQVLSIQAVIDVDTPANPTFEGTDVNTTDDEVTVTNHGLTTGLKVQVSNSGGALPTGLSATTDYFIIKIDANTLQFATNLVNALAGTAINLTAQGSGTNTIEVTALAGASTKLQQSNDGTNWSDLGSSTNITTDVVLFHEKVDPSAKYARVYYTLTAGRISADHYVLAKGLN